MVYFERYKAFSEDKQGFFSQIKTTEDAKARADEKDYAFLADHRQAILDEFNQNFAVLKKQNPERKEFWLYCYYCSLLLEHYYQAYDKKEKAEEYRAKSKKIAYRCDHGAFEDEKLDEETFIESLQRQILADLDVLASTPKHIVKIRDWIAFANIYRIHATFCRLTVRQSIFLA